jgi:hypothetical protein
MTARDKFLAVAVVVVSIPIVYRVSVCGAILMAAMLLIVLYIAWKELDGQ